MQIDLAGNPCKLNNRCAHSSMLISESTRTTLADLYFLAKYNELRPFPHPNSSIVGEELVSCKPGNHMYNSLERKKFTQYDRLNID